MKYFLFTIAALSSVSALAADRVSFKNVLGHATAEQPLCFGREFSTKHMDENPHQRVRKFRAKLVKDTQGNEDVSYLLVDTELRGDENLYKVWRAYLVCSNSTGRCAVECDGGSVDVWGHKDGTLTVQNNGFQVQGGCGEDEENAKKVFIDSTRGADDVFELSRLPSEFCQK